MASPVFRQRPAWTSIFGLLLLAGVRLVRLGDQSGTDAMIWGDSHIRHRMNSRSWAAGVTANTWAGAAVCGPVAQLSLICVQPWLSSLIYSTQWCGMVAGVLYAVYPLPWHLGLSPSTLLHQDVLQGSYAYILWGLLGPLPCNANSLFLPGSSLASKCSTRNGHSLCQWDYVSCSVQVSLLPSLLVVVCGSRSAGSIRSDLHPRNVVIVAYRMQGNTWFEGVLFYVNTLKFQTENLT